MQALILAAGRGSRLGEGAPKCLLNLGDRALIEHQLAVLRGAGIQEVGVVVGYGAERVRATLGEHCHFIENPRFAETNSLYSLWLARTWVRGPFLQLNCDVLAHPKVYQRLLAARGNALAYDSCSGESPEHMKVCVRRGLLQAIDKELDPARSSGENLGLLKFDGDSGRLLFEEAEQLLTAGGESCWSPAATARLARRVPVQCIDMAGLPWTEIDFVEDFLFARFEILPELGRAHASAPGAASVLPRLGRQVLHALSSMGGIYDCTF